MCTNKRTHPYGGGKKKMKTEITLNQYELETILNMLKNFNTGGDDTEMDKRWRTVTLVQEGGNGIGTILNAQFTIEHNGIEGEFMVRITDENDW
jgi:hypothetical protein